MSFAIDTHNMKVYHQSKGLTLQFILAEFIKSYDQVLAIHQFPVDHEKVFSSIIELTGSCKNSTTFFSWDNENGILARLKNYCACFTHLDDKKSNLLASEMYFRINQAFLNSLQSLDILRHLNSQEAYLQKSLKKIVDQMKRFSKALASLLLQFKDDENVIFFLLRHKKELDQIYGKQFVFKLINRMYPKGIEEASNFVLKQYKKRGFHHFIPVIKKKIAEL